MSVPLTQEGQDVFSTPSLRRGGCSITRGKPSLKQARLVVASRRKNTEVRTWIKVRMRFCEGGSGRIDLREHRMIRREKRGERERRERTRSLKQRTRAEEAIRARSHRIKHLGHKRAQPGSSVDLPLGELASSSRP